MRFGCARDEQSRFGLGGVWWTHLDKSVLGRIRMPWDGITNDGEVLNCLENRQQPPRVGEL